MTNIPFSVMTNVFDQSLLKSAWESWPSDGWGGTERQRIKQKKRSMTQVPAGPLQDLWREGLKLRPLLQKMWGISGLQEDPLRFGAGLHETLPGGSLGMHVDFNSHVINDTRMYRRVNT